MAKGCVYIPKTGKDAGKVFGSKDSLAAHMNYTPAMADVMARYEKTGGAMNLDSVTKWLTNNGYLKAEAKKPTTTGEDIKSFFSNIGNQNLAIMEADILKAGKSVISNISKATPEQRKKIDADIEQLKNKYPERNITSRVENGNLIVESGVAAPKETPQAEQEAQPSSVGVGGDAARKSMSKEIDSQISAKENELIEKQKQDIEKAKKDLEAIKNGDKSVIDEYVKKSGYKPVTKEVIANNPKSELLKKSEGKYYNSTGASIQVKTAEQIAIDGASKKANSKPTGSKAGTNQYVDAYNAITKFSEGKITAEEAKSIIEKAGLKIPKAVEQSLKETAKAETPSQPQKPKQEKKPTTKKEFPKAPVTDAVKTALKSVDNTTAAIMNLAKVLPTVYESIAKQVKLGLGKPASQQIAEAYHNAVENGVEPELVAAVENAVALQEQMKSKPSMASDIETAETLEVEGVPNGVRVSNKASMAELERRNSGNATKKATIAMARAAAKTLKSVFPMMDIHLHENTADYNNAMSNLNAQRNTAGNFTYSTSSDGTVVGRIDIDLNKAVPRTVAHEVVHAVLLKTFGDSSPAFLEFRKNLEKIVSKSGNARLQRFVDQYKEVADETGQAEEYLAELGAILSDKEKPLEYGIVRNIAEMINKAVSAITFGRLKVFEDLQNQKDTLEFFNTIAQSIKAGKDISGLTGDNIFTKESPNAEGEVGVFKLKSKASIAAPKASEDSRPWVKKFVTDVDMMKFDGQPFVTNMYDYTTAGEVTMGEHKIELMGGKSYVPYMMHKNNKKLGQVSNLAAFNSKENAEGFVRNAIEGGANLFAPHSGTLSQSWQFQHHTFTELVNLVLDKNILTNEELIGMFNNIIKSAGNKADFKQFREEYFKESGKKINNFSSFVKNPKEIVGLLDIDNNFAPNLRKTLNSTLSANKKFQEGVGIKNKEQFYEIIMDPLNAGVTGGEILGVIDFDPTTFQIVKTTPGATNHHPSFGWALMAKINGIYQPTEFYNSYDVTDTYTKYNKGGVDVSKKSDGFKEFISSNVKSSAGAIPKIAKFNVADLKSKAQMADLKPGEEIALKDGNKVVPTSISGQTKFFHASSKKRDGRLRANEAPQWGKAIYFATSRQAATDEFGGDNVTEAGLNLKNPVYTNTKEFKGVDKKAVELYNKAMLPKILKEEAELVNGKWRFFDEDLQAEYDKNGYIDKYSSSDIEEGKYFGQAAKELGYDAIIDEGGQYGTEIAVLDENAVIYPEDMKPKSDLEAIEEKGGTVYHGGEIVNLKSINENEPFFVTESESEAIAYSKGNSGDVFVAKIDLSKIGNEEVARNILKKMGYSDEYMLHELIDPRFEESYIGKNNVKKLYSEIEKQGYIGISFNDTGIANKKQVTNIFLISPKETLSNSGFETNKIVNEWRSSELLEQGYFPVIDGKIIQNPTEEELNNYFSKNEYLNMVKPSVSKGQFSLIDQSKETPQAVSDGDVISVTTYNEKAKKLAHAVKDGDADAINIMAKEMAAMVPANAVLIPMPSRSGRATNMKDLAEAISKITGAPVADVLTGKKRKSLYEAKKKGETISVDDLKMQLIGKLPNGKVPVVVDNVLATGATFKAAKEAIPNAKIIVHSVDQLAQPALKSKAQMVDNNAKEVADLYAQMREGGGWAERQKINAILDQDPKLSYIYNNFKAITQMLEDAELLTKSGNCP
jgi:predicted amidophosphoribosyltransferase